MSTSPRMGAPEWGLLILLSVIWGGSFFFIGVAVRELPPAVIVFARLSLAALALTLYVLARGARLPAEPRLWGAFLVMGALNTALPSSLIVWGQTRIDSGLASILNATTPLFTVLLAALFVRAERPTPAKFVGVLIGFLGVALLLGHDGLGGSVTGQLAVLGATICYAVAGLYGRRLRALPPDVNAAGMLISGTVLVAPPALLEQPWSLAPSPATVAALLGLALLGTSFAYILYFRLLARAGATNTMLVTLLIPVSALLLGTLFLGERPAPASFAGMALIFAGLAVIDGRAVDGARRLFRTRPLSGASGD